MNERKLIDEIKRLVNDDVIIGYYNGTTFTDDNGRTYSNLVTNNSPIGRGFIVPYNNGWLVVVPNNNEEVRKNIIKYRRKNEIEDPQKYPVKTIFAWQPVNNVDIYEGGDIPSKIIKNTNPFNGYVVNGRVTKSNKNLYSLSMSTPDGAIYFYREGNQLSINSFPRGGGGLGYQLGDGVFCSLVDNLDSQPPGVTLNITPNPNVPEEELDEFSDYTLSCSTTLSTSSSIKTLVKGSVGSTQITNTAIIDYLRTSENNFQENATLSGSKTINGSLANLSMSWSGIHSRSITDDGLGIASTDVSGGLSGSCDFLFINKNKFSQVFSAQFNHTFRQFDGTLNRSQTFTGDAVVSFNGKPLNSGKYFVCNSLVSSEILSDSSTDVNLISTGNIVRSATDLEYSEPRRSFTGIGGANVTGFKATKGDKEDYPGFYVGEKAIYSHSQGEEGKREFYIVHGTIASMSYDFQSGILTATLSITKIKKTPTLAFACRFVLHNGCFYNFFFSEGYGGFKYAGTTSSTGNKFICDKSLPVPILSPIVNNYSRRNISFNDQGYKPYPSYDNIFIGDTNINITARGKLQSDPSYIPLFAVKFFPKNESNSSYKENRTINGTFYPEYYSAQKLDINNIYVLIPNVSYASGAINGALSRLMVTMNIVKNKIYIVRGFDNTVGGVTDFKKTKKAYIAEWDIKDDGDILFNKVFEVPYLKLNVPESNFITHILSHSYYPS